MRQWALVGVSVLSAVLLLTVGRGTHEGKSWVEVTVVPNDALALGCAGGAAGLSCAFGVDGAPVQVARPLRPFMTTAGRLVLLPGLFEEPAVAAWLTHPKTPTERVRVRCDARRLVHEDVELGIRFGAGDPFGAGKLTVAEVSNCSVR